VVVVGQGRVGLRVALRAAEAGYTVVGFEVDERRVAAIAGGDPCADGVDPRRLESALRRRRYAPTVDPSALEAFDVAVIAVPVGAPDARHTPWQGDARAAGQWSQDGGTPAACDGSWQGTAEGHDGVGALLAAGDALGKCLRPGAAVVLESTVPPGTTRNVLGQRLEEVSGLVAGRDFVLGYSAERIDVTEPALELHRAPKVVAGIDPGSTHVLAELYRRLVPDVVTTEAVEEAELAKLVENAWRYRNIGFVNEVALAARRAGLDPWEALRLAATKPVGYMAFRPGPGAGGSCLPSAARQLRYWMRQQGHGVPHRSEAILDAAIEANEAMPVELVARLEAGLARRGRSRGGPRARKGCGRATTSFRHGVSGASGPLRRAPRMLASAQLACDPYPRAWRVRASRVHVRLPPPWQVRR
jgi:UDP-N-acetyl-D-glucosamine dehydrogenase